MFDLRVTIGLALCVAAGCMPSFDDLDCYSSTDCIGTEQCINGRCAAPLDEPPDGPPQNADAAVSNPADASRPPPPPPRDAGSTQRDAGTTPQPDAGTATCPANTCLDCSGRKCDHLDCSGPISCIFDCTNGGECKDVKCRDGAECLLLCQGAVRCDFDRCRIGNEDHGEQSCPGDIVVCNRPCP